MIVNIALANLENLPRFEPGQVIIARDGRVWEVLDVWQSIAPNGNKRRLIQINMHNPETGHGWGGVVSADQLNRTVRA